MANGEGPKEYAKTLSQFITYSNYFINIQINETFRWLYRILLKFKHPGFDEEREWRLIHIGFPYHPPEWIKHRDSAGTKIPYVELPLHLELETEGIFNLESIRFGPAQKDAAAWVRTKSIAESLGYPDVKIMGSNIPWKP